MELDFYNPLPALVAWTGTTSPFAFGGKGWREVGTKRVKGDAYTTRPSWQLNMTIGVRCAYKPTTWSRVLQK